MIFIVREGFRTLLNICMVRALSCILVQDLRILNLLMTSSAVHLFCLMVSSLRRDSSTWSSLAKFLWRLSVNLVTVGQVTLSSSFWGRLVT